MGIFRAYDIRGVYGEDLDEAVAHRIGRAYVRLTGARRVVVGRDMRLHSEAIAEAFIAGLLRHGVEVLDIGLVSTPICYFANGALAADGSAMITASHNPAGWNGLKLCRADAAPLQGGDRGQSDLEQLEALVGAGDFGPDRGGGGREQVAVCDAYYRLLARHCRFSGLPVVVADHGNGMGAVEIAGLRDRFALRELYGEPDGAFPNHAANPLDQTTLGDLCAAVRERGSGFGVAFDGDADRCGFVDEEGQPVGMDLMIAVVAADVLRSGPATIIHDLRSSWAVREHIRACGGTPVMSRVGHAFAKPLMRETGAAFGGELAGHYYFRENCTAESSGLMLVRVCNILEASGKTLRQLVAPLRKYANSGEINFPLGDRRRVAAVLAEARSRYRDGDWIDLDGLSVEYADWWFNLRPSHTEPKLRLLVEARDAETMTRHRDDLSAMIRETV